MRDQAKVLIIDDEPQIRKFLRISLGAQGYEVIEAENGKSGILSFLILDCLIWTGRKFWRKSGNGVRSRLSYCPCVRMRKKK
jgi:hypothetical protein